MQSWCPEPFDLESEGTNLLVGDGAAFTDEPLATAASADQDDPIRFRREAGFTDPDTILSHMSRQERAVVFELVELDVAAAYESRERELRDSLQAENDKAVADLRETSRTWTESFVAGHESLVAEMSASCARLAVDLAEKIVRARVEADPSVVARAVETALRSGEAAGELVVTVSPEDAAWLEGEEDLRRRLGIVRVVADRRVTRGGCMVAAGDREWNATLEGQLSTLGEVVEEWLATARSTPGETESASETGKDPVETPLA